MIANLKVQARHLAKLALQPVLYRFPPIGLNPERLHLWTQTLLDTKDVPGAVVEIGCANGGTAVWSNRLLRNIEVDKPYVCVDTFGGFVEDQFDADKLLGTPEKKRLQFSATSIHLVRRIVDGLGSPEIKLIQGDICTLPADRLPDLVSACLIDVDLSEPVYAALQKIYPRLAPGGVIIVDDCPSEGDWRARLGYLRFIDENNLSARFEFGMGIVTSERKSPEEPNEANANQAQ